MRSRIPLLALAALILACNSGGSSSLPATTRIGSNAGLSAQVEVLYDGVGAPHVYAQSDADAEV